MTNAIPYILSNNAITVVAGGKPITINRTHDGDLYSQVLDAIRNQDWDAIPDLADKVKVINDFGKGELVVRGGHIYYKNEEVHGYVVQKILDFIDACLPADPLINFLTKLLENPSKGCIDRLLTFLEHGNMPIDPDGDFYAYKAVKSDFMDKHTGKISNKIGDVVSMVRNRVDDNASQDCSYGLHAGSLQYVSNFKSGDDKMIVVKINPMDVVSVPVTDSTKLRCCKYLVTGVYEGPLPENTYHQDPYEEMECNQDCACRCNDDDDYCPDCGNDYMDCHCDCE